MTFPRLKLAYYLITGCVVLVLLTAGIGGSLMWVQFNALLESCRDEAEEEMRENYEVSEAEIRSSTGRYMRALLGGVRGEVNQFLDTPSFVLEELHGVVTKFSADDLTDPAFISTTLRSEMLLRLRIHARKGLLDLVYEALPFSASHPDAVHGRGGLLRFFKFDTERGALNGSESEVYFVAETQQKDGSFGSSISYKERYHYNTSDISTGHDDHDDDEVNPMFSTTRTFSIGHVNREGHILNADSPCFWNAFTPENINTHGHNHIGPYMLQTNKPHFPENSIIGNCVLGESDVISEQFVVLSQVALFNAFKTEEDASEREANVAPFLATADEVYFSKISVFQGVAVLPVYMSFSRRDMPNNHPRQGNRVGLFSASIDLSVLSDILRQHSLPEGSLLYIVDNGRHSEGRNILVGSSIGLPKERAGNTTWFEPHITPIIEHTNQENTLHPEDSAVFKQSDTLGQHGRFIVYQAGGYAKVAELNTSFLQWRYEGSEYWSTTEGISRRSRGVESELTWYMTLLLPADVILKQLVASRERFQEHHDEASADARARRDRSVLLYFGVLLSFSVLAIALSYALVIKLTKPILQLSRDMVHVSYMKMEDARQILPPSSIYEIDVMHRAFQQVVQNLIEYKHYIPQSFIITEDSENTERMRSITTPTGSGSFGLTPPSFEMKGSGSAGSDSRPAGKNSFQKVKAGAAGGSVTLGLAPTESPNSANATLSPPFENALPVPRTNSETSPSPSPQFRSAGNLKKKSVSIVWFNLTNWHDFALAPAFGDVVTQKHTEIMQSLLDAVHNGRGVQDLFSGDRIMCTFNAFTPNTHHKVKCVSSAAQARSSFASIEMPVGAPAVGISFSCTTADALVGHMGCAGMKKVMVTSPSVGWGFALERVNCKLGLSGALDMFITDGLLGVFDLRVAHEVSFPKRCPTNIRLYEYEERPGGGVGGGVEWMYEVVCELSERYRDWNAVWDKVFSEAWDEAGRLFAALNSAMHGDDAYLRLRSIVEAKAFTPLKPEYH